MVTRLDEAGVTSIGCLSGDSGSSATMHSCVCVWIVCVSRVCAFSWGVFCHKGTFIWALVHLWPAGCQSFLSKHVCSASRDRFFSWFRGMLVYFSKYCEKGEEVNLYGVKAAEMSSTLASKILQNYLIRPLPDCPRWQQGPRDQACLRPSLSGTTCSLHFVKPTQSATPSQQSTIMATINPILYRDCWLPVLFFFLPVSLFIDCWYTTSNRGTSRLCSLRENDYGWTNMAAFCLAKLSAATTMLQAVFTGEDNGETAGRSGGREGGKLHEAIVDTQQSGFYYANKIYLQTPFGVTYQPMMGCGNLTTANGRNRIVLCATFYRNPSFEGSKVCFCLNFFFVCLFLCF